MTTLPYGEKSFDLRMSMTNADILKLIVTHGASQFIRSSYSAINRQYYISGVPQKFSMYSWQCNAMHVNMFINSKKRVKFVDTRIQANITEAKNIELTASDAHVYITFKTAQRISKFNDMSKLSVSLPIKKALEEQREMFEYFDQRFLASIDTRLNCFDISKF